MESLLKPSGTTDRPGTSEYGATVNAPEIKDLKTLRATVRAISSVDQIYSIAESCFDPGSERNVKNGIIALQINDAPPYGSELKGQGQSYRHNMSTGFLSGILEPAINSPVDVIDQAQYLTSASLDAEDDPDGTKTEGYRIEFTKTVRGWDGYRSHIYNIAGENVSYGYAASVCDDPYDWRPEDCRQDNFGVPDDTGQIASKCQFFVRRKSFLLHELIEILVDQPDGSQGPWDKEACVEALNEAMPRDRNTQGDSAALSNRTFADLVRDGNSGAAHDPKARTVDVYILLATEADGKISKYIVTQRGGGTAGDRRRLLYESEDEFEKLNECVVFYSLKPGTGTLYSSKGGGRDLVNLSLAQERGRNKSCDHTYLGSLVWMTSEKGMVAVQVKVMQTAAIIGAEAKVEPNALPDRSEAFDKMDERLTRWAEQKFGPFIPQKLSEVDAKDKRTATEYAGEEKQSAIQRAGWLKRFFGQFGDEMTIVAKKLGSPDTKDEVAKEFQKTLEEKYGINAQLLKKLVNQPQGQLIEDLTQKRTMALIQGAPAAMASPFFDKFLYTRELSIRTLGLELTQKLLFKNGIDPTREARNRNQQELENAAIVAGGSPEVVPDDHHKTHLKWLVGHLNQDEPDIQKKVGTGELVDSPKILDNWQTAIKHGDAHVAAWEQQAEANKNGDDLKEAGQYKGRLAKSQQDLDNALKATIAIKQMREKSAAAQQQQPQEPQAPQQGQKMSEALLEKWVGLFDKLPPDIQRQIEQMSGLQPSQMKAPVQPNGKEPLTPKPESAIRQAA